jgi:hypothetical protein
MIAPSVLYHEDTEYTDNKNVVMKIKKIDRDFIYPYKTHSREEKETLDND